MNVRKLLSSAVLALLSAGAAHAVTLPGTGYYTYGNTNVYSMPILANVYNINFGGGVGPGNPFYIPSTPGAIKDLVVIYTGSNGTGVTTNAAGFDDSYGTPNGQIDYASIAGGIGVVNPGNKSGIANNDANTWDANLFALKGMLAGGTAQFMFNNNDENKDQNLAIWAKLWLTDDQGALYGRHLYLTNRDGNNNALAYGAGGTPNGATASTFNGGNVLPSVTGGGFGPNGRSDYVLAGGEVCVDNGTGAVVPPMGNGNCPGGSKSISHNLGANQVAYVGDVPLLNTWLGTLFGSLSDTDLAKYTMHLDLKLGCHNDVTAAANDWATCDSVAIDNGFEQLFLASSNSLIIDVPEPKGLALVGLGLLVAVGLSRRRACTKG
jgi:hypothetical protein